MRERFKKSWADSRNGLGIIPRLWKESWISKLAMITALAFFLMISATIYDRLGVTEKFTNATVINTTYVPERRSTRSYTDSDGNYRTTTDYDPEHWITIVDLPKISRTTKWTEGDKGKIELGNPKYVGKDGEKVKIKYFTGRLSGKYTLMNY